MPPPGDRGGVPRRDRGQDRGRLPTGSGCRSRPRVRALVRGASVPRAPSRPVDASRFTRAGGRRRPWRPTRTPAARSSASSAWNPARRSSDSTGRSSPTPSPCRGRRRACACGDCAIRGAARQVLVGASCCSPQPLPPRGSRSAATPSRRPGRQSAAAGVLIALDANREKLQRQISVGDTPTAVAVGEGAVWLVDGNARTVSRVDMRTAGIDTFATGATPTDVASAAVAQSGSAKRRQRGRLPGRRPCRDLPRTDRRGERTTRAEVALPRSGGADSTLVDNHIAVTTDAVWIVGPDSSIARIDVRSDRVTSTTQGIRAIAVAAGRAGVWALGVDGTLAQLDGRSGRIVRRTRIHASSVGGLAVSGDAVWVTSSVAGTLWRTVVAPRLRTGSLSIGSGAGDVTVDGGRVWVVNPLKGTVTEVDASTNSVVRTINVGGVPRSVAASGGRVWVAISNAATPATVSTTGGITALPAATCGPVVYGGGGHPDVLIVSDLPLQGGVQVSTTQMAQAIQYSLRQRGFRAGRFRVAYQSCDDSGGGNRALRRGPMCRERPDVCRGLRCAGRHRPAQLAVRSRRPADSEPRARRSPRDRLAAEFLPRADTASAPAHHVANWRRCTQPVGATTCVSFRRMTSRPPRSPCSPARSARTRVVLVDDGDPGYGVALASAFERAGRRIGLTSRLPRPLEPAATRIGDLAEQALRAKGDRRGAHRPARQQRRTRSSETFARASAARCRCLPPTALHPSRS